MKIFDIDVNDTTHGFTNEVIILAYFDLVKSKCLSSSYFPEIKKIFDDNDNESKNCSIDFIFLSTKEAALLSEKLRKISEEVENLLDFVNYHKDDLYFISNLIKKETNEEISMNLASGIIYSLSIEIAQKIVNMINYEKSDSIIKLNLED